MPTLLTITDGTTTIDFVSSTSGYKVTSWNPAVAKRRRNLLGGAGPYEDVDEEMEITIHGTDALTKLSSLQGLLEQSQRWYRGEPVSAVLLKYKPESTSSELQVAIIGDSGREMIELPRNFPDSPVYDYIDPIVLRFRRRGMWLKDAVEATVGSAAQPYVESVSTTSVGFESPLYLHVTGSSSMHEYLPSSIFLVTSGATTTHAESRIRLIDGAAGSTSGRFTTASDVANLAKGLGLLRYTCSTASSEQVYAGFSLPSFDTSAKQWGMYLLYRNNSTASFSLRFNFASEYFPTFHIPTGTSDPAWAYVGSVSPAYIHSSLILYASGDTTAATLDIDTVLLCAQDQTTDHAIAIAGSDSVIASATELNIHPRPITAPMPRVYVSQPGVDLDNIPFSGDAYLTMRGAAMAAVWLGGQNPDYPGRWRIANDAGNTFVTTFKFSVMEGLITPK